MKRKKPDEKKIGPGACTRIGNLPFSPNVLWQAGEPPMLLT
jgi:hypothetical protein